MAISQSSLPTDEAFEALGSEALDVLRDPETETLLIDILLNHIVEGVIPSILVEDGSTVQTVGDAEWDLTLSDGDLQTLKVSIANVVLPDILAFNGVIHVIDKVLLTFLPPGTVDPASPAPTPSADDTAAPSQSGSGGTGKGDTSGKGKNGGKGKSDGSGKEKESGKGKGGGKGKGKESGKGKKDGKGKKKKGMKGKDKKGKKGKDSGKGKSNEEGKGKNSDKDEGKESGIRKI